MAEALTGAGGENCLGTKMDGKRSARRYIAIQRRTELLRILHGLEQLIKKFKSTKSREHKTCGTLCPQ